MGMAWILSCLVCTATPGEVASTYLQHCREGKFEQAAAMHDEAMQKALPLDKLTALWKTLDGQVGKLNSVGKPRESKVAGFTAVLLLCKFEKTELDGKVVVDATSKVAGLFFVPREAPKSEVTVTPSYIDPKRFHEREIEIGAVGWPLGGTLAVPNMPSKPPVIILVHGSGPQDRDEKIGPNAPFRDLAQGLAGKGIAVIRYDKRTLVHKEKLVKAADQLTLNEEVIDDALAAIAWARNQPDLDATRVYLLGHSLGGSCAPQIAKLDGKLAGIVLMAAANRTPDEILLDQFKYVSTADPAQAEAIEKILVDLKPGLAKIKAGLLGPDEKVLGIGAPYWKSWMGLTPARTASSLTDLRILVLQGGRDYQVIDEDFNAFRSALEGQKHAEFHSYADLNHLFHTGKVKAVPKDYEVAGSVDVRVLDDISKWVESASQQSSK